MTREEAIRKLQKQKAEYLEEWVDFSGVAEAYDMAIEALSAEAAQPEQRWIPCSERLPDMPIRVLVQLDNGWIITAYREDNEWLSVPDFGETIKDKWVEAWMPLPEPYREDGGE